MINVGVQLRKTRKKSNLTLDQLAAASGVDRGTISRIELGHVSPRIDTILFLCKAMDTSLSAFFGEFHEQPVNGSHPVDGHAVDGHAVPVQAANGHTVPGDRISLPPVPPPGFPRPELDGYWPVPSTFWQGLMEVLERFEVLMKNGRELVLVKDLTGTLLYASPPSEAILGYKASELVGMKLLNLVHPDQRAAYEAMVAQAATRPLAGASPLVLELQLQCKDRSWRRISAKFTNQLGNPSIRAIVINALDLQTLVPAGRKLSTQPQP
jgi:PAS domain S-box-containing protein